MLEWLPHWPRDLAFLFAGGSLGRLYSRDPPLIFYTPLGRAAANDEVIIIHVLLKFKVPASRSRIKVTGMVRFSEGDASVRVHAHLCSTMSRLDAGVLLAWPLGQEFLQSVPAHALSLLCCHSSSASSASLGVHVYISNQASSFVSTCSSFGAVSCAPASWLARHSNSAS